ncbi:MAG: YhcH/YjgK/YiaL family protein [Planctomycetota bacterium]|nr:YhcH/YjgK/YiaL family protein [Planctomycetota bacterium]
MLLDSLHNAERSFPLHPGFAQAFDYLRKTDFSQLAPGRHPIDGSRLYLMLNQGQGRGHDAVKFECHRQYIDIQYTIQGPDEIGWKPLEACQSVYTPYDGVKDFMLFADRPEIWVPVPAGTFAIFFPEDVHAPMGAPASVGLLKAVLKVAVDWK